ncbi:hypothetical protein Pcinc_029711 [Petrolisthes cinctipes]|uniref:Uncharacterized protein n=1 Tax=Petrolisthes cinctipes TaxID=88211 RepID=A0AAE1F0A1_PETCI|nr:hypothetical protein Pcinc_029711 [Petrolisthes cinctipes]
MPQLSHRPNRQLNHPTSHLPQHENNENAATEDKVNNGRLVRAKVKIMENLETKDIEIKLMNEEIKTAYAPSKVLQQRLCKNWESIKRFTKSASKGTKLTSDEGQQVNQGETAHPPQSRDNIAEWWTSEGRMARVAVYGPPRRSTRPVVRNWSDIQGSRTGNIPYLPTKAKAPPLDQPHYLGPIMTNGSDGKSESASCPMGDRGPTTVIRERDTVGKSLKENRGNVALQNNYK